MSTMATPQPITNALLQESIVNSVQNVCRTMMGHDATLQEAVPGSHLESLGPLPHVIGSVGFAGQANGLLYLCLSMDFAKKAAEQILGMSSNEIAMHGHEVVMDAIGELTNMMTGGFKNALCDVGYPCKLSLPSIVRGENLTIASIKPGSRHIYRFLCNGQKLTTDIQIKESSPPAG